MRSAADWSSSGRRRKENDDEDAADSRRRHPWPFGICLRSNSGAPGDRSAQGCQQAAGINGAAMFVAMGTVAFAECPKAGFKVNPNGWHALVEATAPGTASKDYFIGGRFSEVGRNSVAFVSAVEMEAGAAAWCGY